MRQNECWECECVKAAGMQPAHGRHGSCTEQTWCVRPGGIRRLGLTRQAGSLQAATAAEQSMQGTLRALRYSGGRVNNGIHCSLGNTGGGRSAVVHACVKEKGGDCTA
eukprot:143374-Chlamydomonas_euryale.AAC.1